MVASIRPQQRKALNTKDTVLTLNPTMMTLCRHLIVECRY